jgi:hypothetical protein
MIAMKGGRASASHPARPWRAYRMAAAAVAYRRGLGFRLAFRRVKGLRLPQWRIGGQGADGETWRLPLWWWSPSLAGAARGPCTAGERGARPWGSRGRAGVSGP